MPKKSPKEILQQSQEPLLVDFYADWCGPCQTLAPLLDRVVAELAGKVILFNVKVDDLQVLSKDRNILGLEIHVGRNRIVRRIFAHLGYEVEALDRVMYAGLDKKDLKRGHYRFLSEQEVIRLKYYI